MKPFHLAAIPLLSLAMILPLAGSAQAATSIGLGTADSFAVLAGAGITNTGPTTINGDMGTFPTTSETGTSSVALTGVDHAGDGVTQLAKNDLVTAYNVAVGESPATPITGDLAGLTLTTGVYSSASSIGLSGALTLDAAGDPNAAFVFQAGSTLTTGSNSVVNLINGANPCNVYWQVGSSATIGTGTTFRGTILAQTSITFTTGATTIGRLLAMDGAVTLDTNTITETSCPASPAPAASGTVTPSAGPAPLATSAAAGTGSSPTASASASQAAASQAGASQAAASQAAASQAAAAKDAASQAAASKTAAAKVAASKTAAAKVAASRAAASRSAAAVKAASARKAGSGIAAGGGAGNTQRQVTRVPSGAVQAGDGSTVEGSHRLAYALSGVLVLTSGAGSVVARRRRRTS